ncbi:hypothetical protein QG37_00087 [Candidozyma auris]|nr:hypothetical protein QG37_00087 [[Candida] auris]
MQRISRSEMKVAKIQKVVGKGSPQRWAEGTERNGAEKVSVKRTHKRR